MFANPACDTIKVNLDDLDYGKENVYPVQPWQLAGLERFEAEKERRYAEENLRLQQQKEAEARQRAEERWQEEQLELLRLEEIEAARVREELTAVEMEAARAAAAEAVRVARLKEEEAMQQLKGAEARELQEREEAARLALLEKQRRQEEVDRETLNAWLKMNGFCAVNSQKKSFLGGSKFPLHEAVAKNDEEIVGLLVRVGADKCAKISKGQTPEDLARKISKDGSLSRILSILQ